MSNPAIPTSMSQTDSARLARIRRNVQIFDNATGFARAHLTRQIVDDLLLLDANGALGRIADILDRGRL